MPKTKRPPRVKYSVLLLYPDYCADAFGQETYYAHVTAATPAAALAAARKKCARANPEEIDEPLDLYCLLLVHGHRHDLSAIAENQESDHA